MIQPEPSEMYHDCKCVKRVNRINWSPSNLTLRPNLECRAPAFLNQRGLQVIDIYLQLLQYI